ncbi:uncharacterized protein LOC135821613 [Sycon ciliatum]|uniref:uncharacterized protein LOC135821613 n=1 Tax=Sycon ciliatum TaxID=27933 RepID=UPI0031F64F66
MKALEQCLPSIMNMSRAPRTVKKYDSAFCRWSKWAERQKVPHLPADPLHVALYLVYIMQDAKTVSPLVSAVWALSWKHDIQGYPDPCSNGVVKNVMQAAKRSLARPKDRKLSLSKPLLERLHRELSSSSLQDLQTLTLIVLGHSGMMRWDDLANIFVDEVAIKSSHMAVFLQVRKNDQLRQGSWVFISRWESDLSPVSQVEHLIEKGGHQGHVKLFGRIARVKGRTAIRHSLSYSRARELVRKALKRIGVNPDGYGLHGLRSGGASTAAAPGVPDRLIQRQGGWRSDAMKAYIQESLPNLLQVSQVLAV